MATKKTTKKAPAKKADSKKTSSKKPAAEVIKTQDPKYVIIGGKLCNAKTKKAIPAGEPVFMIRGKDKNATRAIAYYASLCINEDHKLKVLERCGDFTHFAGANPAKMHDADS